MVVIVLPGEITLGARLCVLANLTLVEEKEESLIRK